LAAMREHNAKLELAIGRLQSAIQTLQFEQATAIGIIGLLFSALRAKDALGPDYEALIVGLVTDWASKAPDEIKRTIFFTLNAFQEAAASTARISH
jgi:hypothetical protein